MITTLDNIERIKSPSFRVFRNRYLLRQEPVVLKDLFEGQPIREIYAIGKARARLGDMKIGLRLPYLPRVLRGSLRSAGEDILEAFAGRRSIREDFPRRCTFREYLDFIAANPRTTVTCTEWPAPPEVDNLFDLPEYCLFNSHAGAKNVFSFIFAANRGSSTSLHYDGDQRHVLFYQVFGRKRVTLIRPSMSRALAPSFNHSLLSLHNIPQWQRLRKRLG